tara:strand:+ start:3059 stop:3829 length:771 start_codon:yes stop_codon:yes gene_type:complete
MKNEDEETIGQSVAGAIPSLLADSDTCCKCGADLGKIESIPICDTCDGQIVAKNKAIEAEETAGKQGQRDQIWRGIAERYADTEAAMLPYDAQRQLIARWQPTRRFGVSIMRSSPTGASGRTRTLWALCRKAFDEGLRSVYLTASEIRKNSAAFAKNGENDREMRRLIRIPVLAIDDFGLQSFTSTSCELFGLLLEKRTKAGRPTLIGCPTSAKDLSAMFTACNAGPTGASILRRIGSENSWILDLDNQSLKTPRS